MLELSRLIWYTMPLAVVVVALTSGTLTERYIVERLQSTPSVRVTRFLVVVGYVTNPR